MTTLQDDVAAQLVARLTTLGVTGYTLGANIREGQPQPPTESAVGTDAVPHKCIFILQTSGMRPEHMQDDSRISFLGIQVIVRGAVGKFLATETLAGQVFAALHNHPPSGYFMCDAMDSSAHFVADDESGHPLFTINLVLQKRE